jgi:hypothetical protein
MTCLRRCTNCARTISARPGANRENAPSLHRGLKRSKASSVRFRPVIFGQLGTPPAKHFWAPDIQSLTHPIGRSFQSARGTRCMPATMRQKIGGRVGANWKCQRNQNSIGAVQDARSASTSQTAQSYCHFTSSRRTATRRSLGSYNTQAH